MNSSRESDQAKAWIDDVKVLQGRTRQARRGLWFPLVLFGLIILASIPFYGYPDRDTPTRAAYLSPDVIETATTAPAVVGQSEVLHYFTGGMLAFSTTKVAIFWLVAGPLGYLATAVFYRLRARRRGVATSTRAYVLTGLLLFVLLVTVSTAVIPVPVHGNLLIRGLTPLMAVALGLFALARVECSWALLGFAVPFLALTVVANLYDMENLVHSFGLGSAGPEANAIVVGSVLILAGVVFGLSATRTRQHLA